MRLAPVERLPIELLQQIYTESDCSLALLQSSPYIATRLSSEYIYNATCDYYLTEVRDERKKQSAAQTCIFASKWMTWSFFKSWCLRRFETKGCLCDRKPWQGCFDAQWPPNFKDATKMVFSRSHLPCLAFVKGRIPRKLLHAPWSQEKIEFLRFLLWITSMSVDWHDPEAAQTAIEGRRQAIVERNLEVVELFNHNRRLGNFPSLETVHFAATEAGCDRSIVYDILLTLRPRNRDTEYHHYDILHKWCDDQEAMGNRKGAWLREKLDETLVLYHDGHAKKFQSMTVSPSNTRSNVLTEDYDGGPDDILTVNELEWNKVIPQRGWLISRARGYSYQTINHNLSWAEVTRQRGYHMYRGPNAPIRLNCWVEHNGASRNIDLWLAPPASRDRTTEFSGLRTPPKSAIS